MQEWDGLTVKGMAIPANSRTIQSGEALFMVMDAQTIGREKDSRGA